eukprot:7385523-Prymnesium_polylepis.4
MGQRPLAGSGRSRSTPVQPFSSGFATKPASRTVVPGSSWPIPSACDSATSVSASRPKWSMQP